MKNFIFKIFEKDGECMKKCHAFICVIKHDREIKWIMLTIITVQDPNCRIKRIDISICHNTCYHNVQLSTVRIQFPHIALYKTSKK